MAGVQRTRIGYGNEGRTKQLAASLSDFIRLFFSLLSSLPPTTQHNTPNLLLCPAHGGVFNREKRQALFFFFSLFFPPPSFRRAHRLTSAEDSPRSISHLHHSDLYDPCFRQQQKKASLSPSLSREFGSVLALSRQLFV